MSQFRQDRTTGLWTIIATERGNRPHEPRSNQARDKPDAAPHPSCPFCPGNEAMLPRIVEEMRANAPPYWLTRVVPNKFPILQAEASAVADPPDAGSGIHEVIIETPRHGADLPDLTMTEIEAVVATWHSRFEQALSGPGIAAVLVFRNHGRAAGASLGHAHSQLVAMSQVPPRLAQTLEWACARFDEDHFCVTCKELALEHQADDRVVDLTDEFAVLVPFAATSPFEQWIVPRTHRPSFGQASRQDLTALAHTVQRALRRLKAVLGDAAYNLAIEPGSIDAEHGRAAHWSVRIVPNVTKPGGFELISGLKVNPSSPEKDAKHLRACRSATM